MSIYHSSEVDRIKNELNNLQPGFSESGIIRTVLRARIEDEKKKMLLGENCNCYVCQRERKRI